MVDLHMHILPGLDDGASSMEESIRMARQAAAGGVNYIALLLMEIIMTIRYRSM